jgi:hypothetical protein
MPNSPAVALAAVIIPLQSNLRGVGVLPVEGKHMYEYICLEYICIHKYINLCDIYYCTPSIESKGCGGPPR